MLVKKLVSETTDIKGTMKIFTLKNEENVLYYSSI